MKKKNENIDDWIEETIEKAIIKGKLFEILFFEPGKRITYRYPQKKLQAMVKRALKKTKFSNSEEIEN